VFGGGSGLANRFVDRVRQREGLSYGAGSGLRVGGRDRAASWQAYAIAAAPNIAKVETALREELARLFSEGVTAKELDDARAGLLQQRLLARADNGNVASAWLNYLDLDRTFAFSQQTEDRIRALTVASVNAAVQRHLDPARMTVFVAGDPATGAH
jgi:zinc protease